MFQVLEALVRSSGKLGLSLKMDGDQMVVVLIPQGDAKESALRQPLVLTATPAELDAGFAESVVAYSGARRSLEDQVAATTAILSAAEKEQAGKAQKTLKGPKRALPAPSKANPSASDDDTENDESDTEAGDSQTPGSSGSTEASVSGPLSGTDMSSLLL